MGTGDSDQRWRFPISPVSMDWNVSFNLVRQKLSLSHKSYVVLKWLFQKEKKYRQQFSLENLCIHSYLPSSKKSYLFIGWCSQAHFPQKLLETRVLHGILVCLRQGDQRHRLGTSWWKEDRALFKLGVANHTRKRRKEFVPAGSWAQLSTYGGNEGSALNPSLCGGRARNTKPWNPALFILSTFGPNSLSPPLLILFYLPSSSRSAAVRFRQFWSHRSGAEKPVWTEVDREMSGPLLLTRVSHQRHAWTSSLLGDVLRGKTDSTISEHERRKEEPILQYCHIT